MRSGGVCRIGWYLQINRTCKNVLVQSCNSFSFISKLKLWNNYFTSQSLVASHLRRKVIRERWIIVTQLLLQVKNSFELRHERASHSFFEQNKGPLKMHGSSSLIISRQRVVKSDGHSLFQQVISYPQSQLILHRTCPTKATQRWPSWTSTLAKINQHTTITEVSLFKCFFKYN